MTRTSSPRGSERFLVQEYRDEIAKIPTMTREDEQRLARRLDRLRLIAASLREGRPPHSVCMDSEFMPYLDRLAELERVQQLIDETRNEMIERSLHLVVSLAYRYRGLGVSSLDLVQEGNASLFKAVEHFDWRRGVRFRTYATFWINQAFLDEMYNRSRTVKVPAYIQKAKNKINRAAERLGERDPSVERLAREANLPDGLVRCTLTRNRYSVSLDAENERNGRRPGLDRIEDPDAVIDFLAMEEVSLPEQVRMALENLNPRERLLLCLRYGIGEARPHTLSEIGAKLGISVERVRQIQNSALAKLRGPAGTRLLGRFGG